MVLSIFHDLLQSYISAFGTNSVVLRFFGFQALPNLAYFWCYLKLSICSGQTKILKAILTFKEGEVEGENDGKGNALTLKEKKFDSYEEFSEFTICWRSNIFAFAGKDIRSWIWGIFFEEPGYEKDVYVGFQDPGSPWTGLLWMFVSTKNIEEVIRSGTGKWSIRRKFQKDVNVRQWNHFCVQSSREKKMISWIHNGMVYANVSQPDAWANSDNFISTDFFLPLFINKTEGLRLIKGIMLHRKYGKNPTSGYITDLQFWKTALTLEEMFEYTTCKSFPEGDLLAWNADDYVVYNSSVPFPYEVVEIESDGLCSSNSNYEFFPKEAAGFDGAFTLCKRFGGRLVVTRTAKDYENALEYFKRLRNSGLWKKAGSLSTYLRFTDRDIEDVWIDDETKEDMSDVLLDIWDDSEPNGEVGENCGFMGTWFDKQSKDPPTGFRVYDVSCVARRGVLCENIPELKFQLRGLCSQSLFDKRFLMRMEPKNRNRFFSGSFGWDLFFDEGEWVIKSVKHNGTIAVHSNREYPLGRNVWMIDNDRCSAGKQKTILNLTPCSSTQFTCDDGVCISMDLRCNQKSDCVDVSDEKGCKMVHLDPKRYLKDKPPPPTTNGEKVAANISVNLLDVLEINEVRMSFKTKYKLFIQWFDPRINFYNLKTDEELNTLLPDEMESIWIPSITFYNTENNDGSISDRRTFGSVSRMGNFSHSSLDYLDNIYIFDGSDNLLTINRIYDTEWICTYDMAWYPFDTQKCSMVFTTTGETGNFVELIVGSLKHQGPKELTRYFIRDNKMFVVDLQSGFQGISFEVTLGRRLLATLLTVFLPTSLLNVIGHSTNYFKAFFFEAVVTVNLTVMLVLTTMFISVSNALPQTSYVKMIDIWLLGNLILPFLEVILHTYKVYRKN